MLTLLVWRLSSVVSARSNGLPTSSDASGLAFLLDDFRPAAVLVLVKNTSSSCAVAVSLVLDADVDALPRVVFFVGSEGSSVFVRFDLRTNWKSSSRS